VDKWFVKVTESHLAALRADMRELGTLLSTDKGECYLVFRDSFVALKVASYLGLKHQHGRTVSAQKSQSGLYCPLMTLENGDVLVTEAA
jgi:hypothetical protein